MKTEKLKPRIRAVVRKLQQEMIAEAVEKYGSRELAAAALGISTQTVRRKLGARSYVRTEPDQA